MNLHKAKGLEAPVVFLADPSGAGDHEPVLHVDRSGERLRGYLAVHGEKSEHSHGKAPLLARPPGWDELAEREKRFLDAEKTRLLYVAATRAGSLLVVSRRESDDRWSCWRFFERHLEGCQRLADPGKVAAPAMESAPVGPAEPAEAREDIRRRWTEALRPTCARHAAKAVSVGATEYADAAGEHGTEWGEVVHALLQVAMADPGADVERLAESVLAEHGIPRGRAAEAARTVRAVTASDLWRRASASPVRLAEVPFEMPEPAAEGVGPAVLRGVVDLAFLEDDRWVVVDYKTDAAARTALGELVERYRGQVRLYGDALARITGREVRETGLYFVSCGEYVRAD